jgi:cytidine deaminase
MSDTIPWKELEKKAAAARDNSWSPYSKFKVGAAVYAGGKIYAAANVENSSYPAGMCAERGALSAAVSDGNVKLDALVLVAGPLITPCGMCRQALIEFGDIPMKMVGVDEDKDYSCSLSELLPAPFKL